MIRTNDPENDISIEVSIIVREANASDARYAVKIADEMESSARARGTGIAKRDPSYIVKKMEEGKAVVAHTEDGTWVGFCYIEVWDHGQFVANSGLIVAPEFRKTGVATQIKRRIFNLSQIKYPGTKIFGLTTGLAVMKMNSELGYVPVTYSELTSNEEFWAGCKSCVNYEILKSKERKNCLCTAMLYNPKKEVKLSVPQAKIKSVPGRADPMLGIPVEVPAVLMAGTINQSLNQNIRDKRNYKVFLQYFLAPILSPLRALIRQFSRKHNRKSIPSIQSESL